MNNDLRNFTRIGESVARAIGEMAVTKTPGPDLDIPPTTDPLVQRAYDLQKIVNAAIVYACEGKSPLRWKWLSEQTVEKLLGDTPWDYLWRDQLGKPPQITITEYRA